MHFSHYVRTLHDALWRGPATTSQIESEKRKSIYRDFNSADAVLADGKILLKGITINIDPPRVIETMHEVLLRDDYAFSDPGPYVMLDIGMNIGIASLSKATDIRCSKIYAYEPVKPTYDLALRNLELNPSLASKIQPFNFGLSDGDEDLTIRFTPNHIMSISSESTFDACFDSSVTNERIQIKKASDVLGPIIAAHRRHKHEKIFLKIDCEGAECKILDDLHKNGLLREIDVAVIEWHGRDPDPILSLLTKNGLFWFITRINLPWNVGLIKAARPDLCTPLHEQEDPGKAP